MLWENVLVCIISLFVIGHHFVYSSFASMLSLYASFKCVPNSMPEVEPREIYY